MTQYPAIIQLSALNGSNGFKISGEAAGDAMPNLQTSLSVADVNGDGYLDLILGAPESDSDGQYSGSAYIIFGTPNGFPANFDLSQLNGANGVKIVGPGVDNYIARSVAGVGDVNHDGVPDVLISDEGFDGYSGATDLIYGHTGPWPALINLGSLPAGAGAEFTGRVIAVSSAGDVNGDGIPDFIIGNDQPNTATGAAYVVFGHTGGFPATTDLSTLNGSNGFSLTGTAQWSFTGQSVASAGDFNGDGYGDILIGAPDANGDAQNAGQVYLVFGHANGFPANIDLATLNGANGITFSGLTRSNTIGSSVASADINGDGYSDLIIGAPTASSPGVGYDGRGSVYVVFGHSGAMPSTFDLASLNGTNGFRIDGANPGDNAGFSVASAGDVNGDGFNDLIIGAPGAGPNGTGSGAAYVVFGGPSGFPAVVNLANLNGANGFEIAGATAGDKAGFTVASAGDLNGDGLSDLIVQADGASPHGAGSGASYVIYGQQPDAAVNRVGTSVGQSLVGGAFNDTLSGMGGDDHLYGNGGDDTLIGGAGNDTIDGGSGVDTAVYSGAYKSYTITPTANGYTVSGADGTDTLTNVEILRFDDRQMVLGSVGETLTARSGGDTIKGGTGDDLLIAGPGNDVLNGGPAGNDTASFINATSGVTVSLAITVAQTTGGSGSDTLLNVDNLIGSNYNDTLSAGSSGSSLQGGAGDDTLISGPGNDTIDGGSGVDTAVYSGNYSAYTIAPTANGYTVSGPGGTDILTNVEILKFADRQMVLGHDAETLSLQASDFLGHGLSGFLIENTAGVVFVGETQSGQAAFTQVASLGPEWSFHGRGDFLGNGDSDFLIQNTGGVVAVGDVHNGQTTITAVAGLGPEWSFRGTGDFLGDGKSDFLMENSSGLVAVGEVVNGAAQYTAVASLGSEWSFKGTGDFLGNGKSDFLMENTNGLVFVGEVVSGVAQYTAVASLGPEWTIKGTGGFLGDGKSDFLMENSSGLVAVGEVAGGQAQYTAIASLGSEWKFVGAGDYLGEGHDQFLMENNSGSVDIGDFTGGQIHFTNITGLGPEWAFH